MTGPAGLLVNLGELPGCVLGLCDPCRRRPWPTWTRLTAWGHGGLVAGFVLVQDNMPRVDRRGECSSWRVISDAVSAKA